MAQNDSMRLVSVEDMQLPPLESSSSSMENPSSQCQDGAAILRLFQIIREELISQRKEIQKLAAQLRRPTHPPPHSRTLSNKINDLSELLGSSSPASPVNGVQGLDLALQAELLQAPRRNRKVRARSHSGHSSDEVAIPQASSRVRSPEALRKSSGKSQISPSPRSPIHGLSVVPLAQEVGISIINGEAQDRAPCPESPDEGGEPPPCALANPGTPRNAPGARGVRFLLDPILPGQSPEAHSGVALPSPQGDAGGPSALPQVGDRTPRMPGRTRDTAAMEMVSMEGVRSKVQEQIVARSKPIKMRRTRSGVSGGPCACVGCLQRWPELLSSLSLRVGGLLQWGVDSSSFSTAYKVGVVLLHVSILAFMAAYAGGAFGLKFGSYADLVVPVSCALGLFINLGLGEGARLQKCVQHLEQMAHDNDLVQTVKEGNNSDALLTWAGWACFVLVRLVAFFFEWGVTSLHVADVVYCVSLLASSVELVVFTTIILRISRYLSIMVNSFCHQIWAEMDYVEAIGEWNVVQATVRMASESVERSFGVLQLTVVCGVLVIVWEVLSNVWISWVAGASLLLLYLVPAHMFLRAAAVTDACTRVPQLINATSFNENPVDMDRKYLVEFIAASEAGFYAFHVRLSSDKILRLFHHTALVAATLARLVFQG